MRDERKMRGKSLSLACLIVLLISSIAIMNVRNARAPTTPNVFVTPSSVIDTGKTPGQTFTVNINISNIERLWSFTVNLRWGPSIVNVSSVTNVGKFLSPSNQSVDTVTHLNQTEGTLYAMASLTDRETDIPQSGSGILLTVQFKVKAYGATILDLYETDLMVLPLYGQPEPEEHTSEDGYFSNVSGTHDVAVTSVTPLQTQFARPPFSISVPINVTVQNQGTVTEAFSVYTYYGGSRYIGSQVVTLSNGASTTVTVTGITDTTGVPSGNYASNGTVVCPVDTDLTDNSRTGGNITLIYRDVAITSVSPEKWLVCQSYSINADVSITNQGDYSETFNVNVYYVNLTHSISFGTTSVTLASKASTTRTFSFNTAGVEYCNYTLRAVASTVTSETDTADNTKDSSTVYVTMKGDVKASFGAVNIIDIVYVALSFDARKGQPPPPGKNPYNPLVDINGDNVINIVDIVIAALNFDESYPWP